MIPTAPGAEAAALDALDERGWPSCSQARRGHPRRGAAGHQCRVRCRRRPGWPIAPAPGWPGFRAGPASAARWTPAACPTCCPAADPVADAAARQQSRRPGTSTSCPPSPAATPPRSSPPRPTATSTRCSSAASTPPTCPTRTPHWPPSRPAGFVVSLELRRVGGHRAGRRRLPGRARRGEGRHRSPTGRAAIRPFEPSLTLQRAAPICGCCRPSPTNSASTSGSGTAEQARAEIAALGAGTAPRAAAPERAARPAPVAGHGRGGAGRLANAAGRRAGYRTASRTWPAPHARRWSRLSAGDGGRRSAPPTATRSACRPAAARSRLPLVVTEMPDGWCGCR